MRAWLMEQGHKPDEFITLTNWKCVMKCLKHCWAGYKPAFDPVDRDNPVCETAVLNLRQHNSGKPVCLDQFFHVIEKSIDNP